MGRRGPQPKWWRDTSTGEMIEGLTRRADGRFHAHQTNITFGKDPKMAVFRFRQWQPGQQNREVKILQDEESNLAALEKFFAREVVLAWGSSGISRVVFA